MKKNLIYFCYFKDSIISEYTKYNLALLKNYIETTYEGVFETGEDINKILKFLNFKNEPKWLDWLDNKRRLRDGKLGINGVKIKKYLI
jgi:hypothetical protein